MYWLSQRFVLTFHSEIIVRKSEVVSMTKKLTFWYLFLEEVKVKESKAHLIFDKPNLLSISKSPGTGLVIEKSGSVTLLPSHGGNRETPLSKSENDQLRKYAVLVQVLSGNLVNASIVNKNSYELETFKQNLKLSTNEEELAARSLWKSALDTNGKTYYFNEVTWLGQWAPPRTIRLNE